MISIIVSTYKPDVFTLFSQNVQNTIGTIDYEIITIDNPGLMGLCEAYNLGSAKAKYPYLCFCHDDISFRTNNWGNILISLFENNKDIGLIGNAGSSYKSWVPSGWSAPQTSGLVKMNFIQTFPSGRSLRYISEKNIDFEEVVSLDGFLLCTTKKILEKFRFDDSTFKSYHCYDVDFSLQVNTQYKVVVCNKIIIEHFSGGSFSKDWLKETYKLHKKWKKYLPVSNNVLDKRLIQEQEENAFIFLMNKTFDFNSFYADFIKTLVSFKFISLVGFKKWCSLTRKTIGCCLFKFISK
jgi:GT2 family glycosyltransferase